MRHIDRSVTSTVPAAGATGTTAVIAPFASQLTEGSRCEEITFHRQLLEEAGNVVIGRSAFRLSSKQLRCRT